jgi:outer membrane immunogenic protein
MRNIKSFLLGTAAVLVAGSALAADLPTRKAAPAPVYVPLFTWTGFYVGLNAGVGWGDSKGVQIYDPALRSYVALGGSNKSGFVGGGQLGYNYQMGNIVLGAEADIQWADLGGDVAWGNYGWFGYSGSNGQYFGTVRARLGYAMDRTLLYITGGLAYGGLNGNWWHGSTSNTGWTIGAGIEYAFTNNWTARLEGLYVNLNTGNHTAYFTRAGVAGNYVVTTAGGSSNGGGVVRVGLNYKF